MIKSFLFIYFILLMHNIEKKKKKKNYLFHLKNTIKIYIYFKLEISSK